MMMESQSKLISPEEMQTLQAGMGPQELTRREQPYDPRRGIARSEQEILALQRIHTEVAAETSTAFQARLKNRIALEPLPPEALTFSALRDVMESTGMACINVLEMQPFGEGLLTFDFPTCFRFIDRCLGGSGKAEVPDRTFFTDIEMATMDDLVGLVISGLRRGWSKVLPDFKPRLQQREFDPKLLTLWPATERILSSTFNIISDIVAGEMKLCLPYPPVAQLLSKPGATSELGQGNGENLAAVPELEHRLQKVPLNMTAILGIAEIPVRDLLNLKEGDLIRLSKPLDHPIRIQVEGEDKFSARLGLVGKKLGLKVEEICPEFEE